MFSGIVEGTGTVIQRGPASAATRLAVDAGRCAEGACPGDSVAVNGCCLTVRETNGSLLGFDLLAETERVTNLHLAAPGRRVNLERSLRVTDRIGGHFLTGHVDCCGLVKKFEPSGNDWILEIEFPELFAKYVVRKGCIAVDGMSLTVVDVTERPATFSIWIIPHTREVTCLGERGPGDEVNLEFDLLAKYTEKILAAGCARG
jgi:riboflavin synthase